MSVIQLDEIHLCVGKRMIDLTGNWTNINKADGDDVVILHIENYIFVHGTDKDSMWYRNFGYAKLDKSKDELENNEVFTIIWTDASDSHGSEKGIVHECKIKIIDENTLEKVEDKVITSRYKSDRHKTSFGNWVRKQERFV